jgi:hypothetical protein
MRLILIQKPLAAHVPLDYAVGALRRGVFIPNYTRPELAVSFMEKIADATIKTIKFSKHYKSALR